MGYLVGRGISDITGESAECGMLGYGQAHQQTNGIHTRQRSRAFVIASTDGTSRVLLIINDLPLVFDSVHQAVLARMAESYGNLYTATNTMITATHTHCGPGGYSHHLLYNTNTHGFRPKTFSALIDGMAEAVERAHADLAPADLHLNHGELRDASVNRSRSSFERNPPQDRAFFPDAIDPQTTLLRISRDGRDVGAINWFPTHNTSMTNRNRLISADNKGYAGYHWERELEGMDYLVDPAKGAPFIVAFAQTNAGDMSPNLNLHPGSGPTEDEFENTRLIGLRQFAAAHELATAGGAEVDGPISARHVMVDLGRMEVSGEFTGDGAPHWTSAPSGGSSSFAGAWADGPAFPGFREGGNRWCDWPSKIAYRLMPKLRDSQAPKGIVLPGRLNSRIPMVAQRVPIQLFRIGQLYLIAIPGEVTIVAGLRLRRTVADIVDAALEDVLVAGYSNGYIHYVTTPEEYTNQRYEGASTLFGRWELAALMQTAAGLARSMSDGTVLDPGVGTADLSARHAKARDRVPTDETATSRNFGDVVVQPHSRYQPGDRVQVEFVGAHPGNDLHRGSTYLRVEYFDAGRWITRHDDGDWSTKFTWRRPAKRRSAVTIEWDIPASTPTGRYRVSYFGDARAEGGAISPFSGSTREFEVVSN